MPKGCTVHPVVVLGTPGGFSFPSGSPWIYGSYFAGVRLKRVRVREGEKEQSYDPAVCHYTGIHPKSASCQPPSLLRHFSVPPFPALSLPLSSLRLTCTPTSNQSRQSTPLPFTYVCIYDLYATAYILLNRTSKARCRQLFGADVSVLHMLGHRSLLLPFLLLDRFVCLPSSWLGSY